MTKIELAIKIHRELSRIDDPAHDPRQALLGELFKQLIAQGNWVKTVERLHPPFIENLENIYI